MDLNLSESQGMLRKAAREFLREECPPGLVREMERDPRGYSEPVWRRIVEMGWPGVAIPEEYGGQGGSFLDLLVLLQEMGRAALPSPFFATAVLGGLTVLEAGSGQQRRTLLPRVCDGSLLLTLALSEPGVDFGLDRLGTSASERNGEYSITGTKVFVPDAHVAKGVLCVTAGAGLSVFLVEPDRPGVSVVPLETNLRDKQFEVTFTDVRVDVASALGGVGRAREAVDRALEKAMVARCAEMAGAGQKLLEMTVEYAKTRAQFGRPLGSFQAIQHHCANLATSVETAELMTCRAGWLIDEGRPCRREVLQAKAWANEAGKRAAALAHQVHGGMGFSKEYDLYLYSTRITTFAHILGGTPWCYDRIAEELGL